MAFRAERGSAVVEFVFVSVPLVLLSMTVIAVGLSNFAMAVIRDSAVEGARFGALADQTSADGCQRATALAGQVIGKFSTINADCEILPNGYSIVNLNAQVMLFGLLPGSRELSAISRAPIEE